MKKSALKSISPVTHDTNHYVFERPDDFEFEPGQATHMALDQDGWRDEDRPFTFTSRPDAEDLEFVIKSYPDHDGVTERLPNLQPGDTVLMEPPAGAITDHGPGVFLAAGAGVTPFIAILRKHDREGAMEGCTLIFSNKTEKDIILRNEWEGMDGLETHFVLTDEKVEGLHHGQIDKAYLKEQVESFDRTFYICGPQGFVDDMRDMLKELGADGDKIITEEGW
ncbi:MAG: FAD-binding oxidoreductase [Sulfitobacter sp.]|nr:FAD-binding oxidoreductase [Sulfitobacter sp.]